MFCPSRTSSILIVCIALFAGSCKNEQGTAGVDIIKAADTWRYTNPESVLQGREVLDHIEIKIANRFPVWRDSISAALDISIRNKSASLIAARGLTHLFVYAFEDKKPLYWSNIDIAIGKPAAPGIVGVISLPVGASKDFSVALLETTWESVHSPALPDKGFYSTIPAGKYLMRLEFELYDESDNLIDTVVSNFVQFTTVSSTPEPIVPQDATDQVHN